MPRFFASLLATTPCLVLLAPGQVPPPPPSVPSPTPSAPNDDEEAAKKMVETVQWAVERAGSNELPTDPAALAAELKRTREAVLLLDFVAKNSMQRVQEMASSRALSDSAEAYVRSEGWKKGSVKGSIRVEKDFGSDTYWVIDGGAFEDYVVEDGGFSGWSSWNPDEFWCKSSFNGFKFIERSGRTSSVSEASVSSDLRQRILSRF
jgi:hypothetical protein